MKGVWIGASGWSYKHWAKSFYPPGCKDELAYYVTQFPTVEINATYYRLPLKSMVSHWNKTAPPGFVFAVKGSRFITHMKKLANVTEALKKYFTAIKALHARTGPVLWQLPPMLKRDAARLDNFLAQLPKSYRYAVEFRHDSWIHEEIFNILRKHNAACVWISSMRMPMDFTRTADFVYARYHGLDGGFAHDYTDAQLQPWADEFRKAARGGSDVFVYFNNDAATKAIANARTLVRMVGKAAVKLAHSSS